MNQERAINSGLPRVKRHKSNPQFFSSFEPDPRSLTLKTDTQRYELIDNFAAALSGGTQARAGSFGGKVSAANVLDSDSRSAESREEAAFLPPSGSRREEKIEWRPYTIPLCSQPFGKFKNRVA